MDVEEDDNEYLDSNHHHHRLQARQGLDPGSSGLGSGSGSGSGSGAGAGPSASDGFEDFQSYDDEGMCGSDVFEEGSSSSSSEVFWGGSLVGADTDPVIVLSSARGGSPSDGSFSGDEDATTRPQQPARGAAGGRYASASTGLPNDSNTGSIVGGNNSSGSSSGSGSGHGGVIGSVIGSVAGSGVGSSLSLAPPSRIGT